MKNTLYIATALFATLFACGCSEQENFAGGDSKSPVVTIYKSSSAKTYQVGLRVAPNTRVKTIYIYTEPVYDREDYIAEHGAEAYLGVVREKGAKFEGGQDVNYLYNPDNNSAGSPGYSPDDDLIGYIITTVLAEDGKGASVLHTIATSCFSQSLSLSGYMRGNTGDWVSVADVAVTETAFKPAGQTGGAKFLMIPNTEFYMIPFVWFLAWGGDSDFAGSQSLIVRLDRKSKAPVAVVSNMLSSGFDDQENGVVGFGYDASDPGCSFKLVEADSYSVTGYKFYGEEVALGAGDAPVMMSISWKKSEVN